jgi:phosphoribosyl 1,2-cyclic phosphodiesterase
MLRRGPYPRPLQDRICGGCGHLSNDECADAIRDFMHEGLRNIFLCHLSAQNNTPELALQTVSKAVEDTGVRLEALPRTQASPLYEL